MGIFDNVTTRVARPLPVILLVDVSGSMADRDKIGVCNRSVRTMVQAFAEATDANGDIQVAVVTFGGESATLHLPLTSAQEVEWADMDADGWTPMGDAFRLAAVMVEDERQVPPRSYQPTLVLVSDGIPTDDWETSLMTLEASGRASRALRLAVAIDMEEGGDEYDVLDRFVGGQAGRVYPAKDASGLADALRWVTFSVTRRARSNDPNDPAQWDVPDLGQPDF